MYKKVVDIALEKIMLTNNTTKINLSMYNFVLYSLFYFKVIKLANLKDCEQF